MYLLHHSTAAANRMSLGRGDARQVTKRLDFLYGEQRGTLLPVARYVR